MGRDVAANYFRLVQFMKQHDGGRGGLVAALYTLDRLLIDIKEQH
jgi:hypothetical protein